MSKLLLLFVVVVVFFWLLRKALAGRKSGSPAEPTKASTASAPELVACAHCGVLLPQNEAIALENPGPPAIRRFFCTEEHVKLGSK